MKAFFLMMIMVCLMLFQACESEDKTPKKQIDGEGPIITMNLDLPAFHRINNSGVSNVYVTIGSPQSVTLKAQQNIIDILRWQVSNNTFLIGIDENINIGESEEIWFDVVIEDLSEISLLGVGSFILEGDFVDELSISLIGVGEVRAYELETGICRIVSTGVGNCWVHVRDELDVTLTGVGNVYYRGSPNIFQQATGIGNLYNDN